MRKRVSHKARPRKGNPYAFKDYEDDFNMLESMVGFIGNIWKGAPADSCFFLATSTPDEKNWREYVVHSDNIVVGLNRFFKKHSRWDFNLYFCPNPFSKDRRKKEFARPSRFGWCDIDESDPRNYRPQPSLLWETSPRRYQGLWLWDGWHSVQEAEGYSKSLAELHGGDSGWTITKMLRVPGSVNHKPEYNEPFVTLQTRNWERIMDRPPLPEIALAMKTGEYVNPDAHDPDEVFKKFKQKLHAKARTLIRHPRVKEQNRSSCIHLIVANLWEVGASTDEIASIMWNCPYFTEKHGYHLDRLDAEIWRIISKLEHPK
ncbi:DNA-primase RepB domain-containing protein [Maritalea porphyrae]|uniref:DNA-primase RepB domain-containing protein n=1 Tax=Maritalea porphyrae TaxID=880732 RepID=UPI0022B052C0|nr:DNA-primase RepB domain-containing protein [Maritalea porphyrae]MCZ4273375.1 DNA-primase RepB domain-containing protein [Maritalea porphyrae]